jgi:hemerythrin
MVFLEWSSELSVNIKEIDEQHRYLVKMINDLHEAMMRKQGRQVMGDILAEMTTYAVKHFATEEKYMRLYRYPEMELHQLEHRKFVETVSKFKADFDANRLGLSIDVMNFLSNWLKDHIMTKDKRFGPFFNTKGLT